MQELKTGNGVALTSEQVEAISERAQRFGEERTLEEIANGMIGNTIITGDGIEGRIGSMYFHITKDGECHT